VGLFRYFFEVSALYSWCMTTNLPPEAKKKWEEAEATRNPREKLKLLEEFLSLVPRHKGTARLCVQVKKQIRNLKKEVEEKKRKRAGKSGPKIFMEKEGAAQIAILGMTKSGKSSLLGTVTNAKVEVSPTPFTTRMPVPGIMGYQDIQFQIIEAPAVMEGSADGRSWGLQTLAIGRNADAIIILVDLSQNPVQQLSLILREMEKARILTTKPSGRVEVERKFMGAGLRIILIGSLINCTMKDVETLLNSYRVTDGVVRIEGNVTLDEIEDAIFESTVYKPALIIANKQDLKGAERNLKLLRVYVKGRIPILPVSSQGREGFENLGSTLFGILDIMRIYTKEPNALTYSRKPFILKKDSSISDLARSIHSDFKEKFAFAKVWSERLVFSPQKVGLSFVLKDRDIVEIHLK
jgi:ribosome-interacting GTPase 1